MNKQFLAMLGVLAVVALLLPATAVASPPERYATHPLHVRPLAATSVPTGLSPAQIKSAYGFSTAATAGAGKTIAIVDAYDDPTAKADLDFFNSTYFPTLSFPTCLTPTQTTCFQKVNQTGNTRGLPAANGGWALEIALDVEWAHAIAPGAKILLVEARSSSLSNLFAAEDYAKAHAQYVSNSWGASEFSSEYLYDGHFSQSGVSIFASSGDGGTQIWPSTSPNVISVGGTTLTFSGGTLASETGWSGSGGGCSAYETANIAQNTGSINCSGKRGTPDVSLDADPNSGVSVYDSTPYSDGSTGWFQVGGTSASSPMWAARSADAGVQVNSAYVYGGNSITYRDITTGGTTYNSCGLGYDLVTGLGSWTG